jgi:hypothetical protein
MYIRIFFIVNFIVLYFYLGVSSYGYNLYRSNFMSLLNQESYDVIRVLIDSGNIKDRIDLRGSNISLRYSLKKYPSIYQGSNNLFNFLSLIYNYPYLEYYYSENKYSINFEDIGDVLVLSNDFIEYKNKKYRGIMRIIFKDQKYYLINYLNLEDYLKSVVPSEMPSTGV